MSEAYEEQVLDGEKTRPFRLDEFGIELRTIYLIDKLMSGLHHEIKLMSNEDVVKCDHAVEALGLDKHRDKYFARSRLGDITGSVRKRKAARLRLPEAFESFET